MGLFGSGVVDLSRVVEFYDPHPCPYGALYSVPVGVKEVLDRINGKRMPIAEADLLIAEVVPYKSVFIDHEQDFIGLTVEYPDSQYDAGHTFRLIKYR